jgi:hypothetical protein
MNKKVKAEAKELASQDRRTERMRLRLKNAKERGDARKITRLERNEEHMKESHKRQNERREKKYGKD